jgi:hypothetical protein
MTTYWMAATPIAAGHSFDVWQAKDPTEAGSWVHTIVDVSPIGSVYYTWAPEWFNRFSEDGHERVHVALRARQTANDIRGHSVSTRLHPIDRGMRQLELAGRGDRHSLPKGPDRPIHVYAPRIGTPGKPYKL